MCETKLLFPIFSSLCFFLSNCVDAVVVNEAESWLYSHLLSNYSKLVRPVKNSSDPLVVSIGVALQQIVDVDEKAQIVEINAWLLYEWQDENLIWEPGDNNGIKDLRFPADILWKPDILLYNSADSEFDTSFHSNLIVYNDGTVSWVPPGIFRSSCKMDVTWFPFDDQTCYLKFGSWSYHGFALDLILKDTAIDTSEYLRNGEWLLMSAPGQRQVKVYTSSPEPYPSVTYFLNIRRRSTYYILNAILPCMIMSAMIILGFWLPPECGERITIEMTVLLSVCFFLSVIANMIPTTSETTPLIGAFFICCMIIVSQSVVWTVIVLNLHYRPTHGRRISGLPRKIMLHWMPRILCMDSPIVEQVSYLRGAMSWSVSQARVLFGRDVSNNDHLPLLANLKRKINPTFVSTDAELIYKEINMIQTSIEGVCQQLQIIIESTEKKDKEDISVTEWHFAAKVVDRLSLILFSFFIAVSTLGTILKVYYH